MTDDSRFMKLLAYRARVRGTRRLYIFYRHTVTTVINILLYSRSEAIFDPKVSHFTTIPKSLYPPKLTSERAVDDVGTGGK